MLSGNEKGRALIHILTVIIGTTLGAAVLFLLYNYSMIKVGAVVFGIAVVTFLLTQKRMAKNLLLILAILTMTNMQILELYKDSFTQVFFSPMDFPLVIVAIIFLVRIVAFDSTPKLIAPDVAFICFIVWNVISVFTSTHTFVAMIEVMQLIKVFILSFCLRHFIRTYEDLRNIFIALGVNILIQGALTAGQIIKGSTLGLQFLGEIQESEFMYYGFVRYSGLTGFCNIFAACLTLLIPTFFTLYLVSEKALVRAYFLFIFLTSVALLFSTYSRSGLISTTFALSLLVILMPKYLAEDGKKRIRMFVKIGLASALIFGGIFVVMYGDRLGGTQRGEAAYARIPSIMLAKEAILENPLLGVGSRNYRYLADKYVQKIRFSFTMDAEWASRAYIHNLFFRIAAENGLPGLIIFLLFLFLCIQELKNSLKKLNADKINHKTSPLLISTGLGIVGSILFLQFGPEYDMQAMRHTFWLILGVSLIPLLHGERFNTALKT
ncbi:O-antigen polymerase [Candidatus Omnitrophus magneticus]|uniref:O-antigen polymerase n=1 Tax=Candidatus Omnitrophus magneticus TaxID=1609969 RepID=A0A0F0CWJ5_9BACT|nr:O-antigen polymerase [Candidatus Omnitrophus magneticus]